jgi:A/G-specific adenine glycosylase
MTRPSLTDFQNIVWNYYQTSGRHDLPWRMPLTDGSFDPYRIMVSELMLQQTQVLRVTPKYYEFLGRFPDVVALAEADLGQVLTVWSGLGYNRRAKFLWQAAGSISQTFHGVFPDTPAGLVSLPGVGKNTAGAILAYAFNQPVTFIETNIRSAYIHHFFADQTYVADAAIIELVEQTLDHSNPREWYWALMDYGSYLKKTAGNASVRSLNYTKQSAFHGSRRQIRGQVLKCLTLGAASLSRLEHLIPDDRLPAVLDELLAEQLVHFESGYYRL